MRSTPPIPDAKLKILLSINWMRDEAIWHGSCGDIPLRRLMDYKAISR
jgi:hypothetical protein